MITHLVVFHLFVVVSFQQKLEIGNIKFDENQVISEDLIDRARELMPEGFNISQLEQWELGITAVIEQQLKYLRDNDDGVCCLDDENQIEKMKKRLWLIRKAKNLIPHKSAKNSTTSFKCHETRIMYPFGLECGDTELSKDLTRSDEIDLGFSMKIMGHRFDKAWVNQHGFISFQESFLGFAFISPRIELNTGQVIHSN